ncbi:MAG: aminotransferase class I/II-fold pyridoxal phosphate-dependent enzyme [Bacillota bacterium]|jgi:aminotransferase|nr:aminotransferase class I/II-fold pyridoxal phosphate-dependent enzyme [Bacillota bacterium]NLV62058.1 aminotransferase class I/II-fold pyridoxal phosphate-dependent enzyme [Clostridiaceae bacterium]
MNIKKMLCRHITAVPPSGIRKYFDMVNEMEDVISLGIGEPDFVTPWNIREEGIYSLEKGYTNYSSNAGAIELRREICRYMERRFNLQYSPEHEVLVTVGGSEAIDLAIRVLATKGDEVIIPEPSFVAYKGCTLFSGATPVPLRLKAENEFRIRREDLAEVVTEKTKALILAYPNNPTGAIMQYDDYAEIVDFLKDREIMIISDELYAELTYEGSHVSIANFEQMKDRTIVINGLSKAYAMTGWRIGYACAHRDVIEQMKKVHQYAIMCAPTTAQYAAIEALKNADDEVAEMVKEYNRRRRLVLNGFRGIGLECFEPKGAFYVFPDIRKSGMTSDHFCERLLMEEKVLMVPGNAFGECGEGFVRATYATSTENLIEAIKRTGRFLSRI